MFYHHCGQKLPAEARFCFKCGTATLTNVSGETPSQDNGDSKQALALPPSSLAPRISPLPPVEQTYNGEAIPGGEPVIEAEIEERFDRASSKPPVSKSEPPDDSHDFKIHTTLDFARSKLNLARSNLGLAKRGLKIYADDAERELREALAMCHQALTLNNQHGEIYFLIGEILEASKRYQDALEAYEQAIRFGARPTSPFHVKARALQQKGCVLYTLQRFREALNALEESNKLVPFSSLSESDRLYTKYVEGKDTIHEILDELRRREKEEQRSKNKARNAPTMAPGETKTGGVLSTYPLPRQNRS